MTSKYPFAAVLFDMDGVIVNTTPLHQAAWTEFARSQGLEPTPAEILATNGRRAVDIIISMFGSELTPEEISLFNSKREVLYRQRLNSTELEEVAGAREFLEGLRSLGIPCILATSANPYNIKTVLSRLEVYHHFDTIVCAEDVRYGKPHPEVYLTAAQKAGVSPEQCLVVEDAIPGVQSAKAAGTTCLGLTTSQSEDSLKQVGADWVAPNFIKLPDFLQIYSYISA